MAMVILLNLFDDVPICYTFLSIVFKFYRLTVLFTDKPLLLSHTLSFIIYVQALPSRVHIERRILMYDEISIEQRAHDLAVQATLLIYQRENLPLSSETNFYEFGCQYRSALAQIRKSISEGKSDLT